MEQHAFSDSGFYKKKNLKRTWMRSGLKQPVLLQNMPTHRNQYCKTLPSHRLPATSKK